MFGERMTEIQNKVAELEKDKARLDWMDANGITNTSDYGNPWHSWEVTCDIGIDGDEPNIRHVIDAAMEATKS